jgi:hypothetical protein
MAAAVREGPRRELMADFGEVMVEIQLFEMALLGLAMSRGYTPDRVGTDDWREHVEQLFAMTAADY